MQQLQEWQHKEDNRGDDIDPERVSADIRRGEEDISEHVERNGHPFEDQREDDQHHSALVLPSVVPCHEFDARKVEQIDEYDALSEYCRTCTSMKAIERYWLASA